MFSASRRTQEKSKALWANSFILFEGWDRVFVCNCTSWFGPLLPTLLKYKNVRSLMLCYELHISMLRAWMGWIWTTISNNNIGQWLPFPPYPLPNICFAGSKKYRKKSRHHCSNIERGEAGEGFCLRVARDFWLRLYSLYMPEISMGLFKLVTW